MSGYYYKRKIAKNHSYNMSILINKTATDIWINKPLEDCVNDVTDRECNDFSASRRRIQNETAAWTTILPNSVPYFCGVEDFCGSGVDDRAANKAIDNIGIKLY